MSFFADAAGTDSQIKHVSRLLAAQMTAAGIGPGVQEAIERQSQSAIKADSDDEENIRRTTNRDKSHMPVDDSILRWNMIKWNSSLHSSEIRGLHSTKCSSEMLQNLLYFYNKKTHVSSFCFVFHFEQLYLFH